MIVGFEPTADSYKGNCSTNELYQPTEMCCFSCWIFFWNTQYNTPRTFGLAQATQSSFTILVLPSHDVSPPTIHTALPPLGATPRTITLPFLILTDWLVICGRRHHPFLLHLLTFPLRASKSTLFPQNQLHHYTHRSYQWALPRGSEQACLYGLFNQRGRVGRYRFGCITALILN